MAEKQSLEKGELMEELLRNFFNKRGFYVARGVKFRYGGNDITDIDLFLYGRLTGLIRQRINVDIKNKKVPQAFERILWANGLKQLLKFDSCIVATTDTRPLIQAFGKLHGTTIINGNILSKMGKDSSDEDRHVEEEILNELDKMISNKNFPNKSWKAIYEISKSRLLTELDYSGANATLVIIKYLLEKILVDPQSRNIAVRFLYIVISHFLIMVDFILKDMTFLEQPEKEKKLLDGFAFGNLGKDGVDKIIRMAEMIAQRKATSDILRDLEDDHAAILRDYFSNNNISKKLFNIARTFESLGFSKNLVLPTLLEAEEKGALGVLLDYSSINRTSFFSVFGEDKLVPNQMTK